MRRLETFRVAVEKEVARRVKKEGIPQVPQSQESAARTIDEVLAEHSGPKYRLARSRSFGREVEVLLGGRLHKKTEPEGQQEPSKPDFPVTGTKKQEDGQGKVGETTVLTDDPNVSNVANDSNLDNEACHEKLSTQKSVSVSESGVSETPKKLKSFWDSSPELDLDRTGPGASPVEYFYTDPPSFLLPKEKLTLSQGLQLIDLRHLFVEPVFSCFEWLESNDLVNLFSELEPVEMVTQEQFDEVKNALEEVKGEIEVKKLGGVLKVYKGTSWEDPQAWWRKFTNHLKVKKITKLEDKWDELHAYLEDAAESWFHDLPAPQYGPAAAGGQQPALLPDQPWVSLEALEKEFLNQFGKRERSYPGMVAFEARVLGKNEKIKDYIDDIRKQGARLGKSTTDVQNAMIRGLPFPMKNFVWQQAPKNMAETIEKIEIAELTIPNCRGDGTMSVFAAKPSIAAMEVDYDTPQTYHAPSANKQKQKKSGLKQDKKENKDMQEMLNAIHELENKSDELEKKWAQGQTSSRRGSRGNSRGRPPRGNHCYNCGIYGHYARDCYRNPNNQGYNLGYNPYAPEFFPQETQNNYQTRNGQRGFGRGRGGYNRGGWNNSYYSNPRPTQQEN